MTLGMIALGKHGCQWTERLVRAGRRVVPRDRHVMEWVQT